MKNAPVVSVARLIFAGLLLLLFFACPVIAAEPLEVDAKHVKALMENEQAVVVFPLSSIEFNHLHIEGSINLPIEQLPVGLPDDKMKALVFYCLGRT